LIYRKASPHSWSDVYYRSWPTSLDMGSGDLNKETSEQQSKRCPHDNEEDVLIPVQYSNVILPASGNSA
jgi:hypothetical protein